MAHRAVVLKEEGNKHFQNGEYTEAEGLYSQAYNTPAPLSLIDARSLECRIQKDPSNPKLFTNRAMTRIKLQQFEGCMDDCLKSIELDRINMKGYYFLAQAQLALNHPNEALSSALTAYEKCLETNDKSTNAVSSLVLQAKKQKWEAKEKERIRNRSSMLRELEDMLMKNKREELRQLRLKMLGFNEEAEEKSDIELECRKKIDELRTIFAIADPKNLQRKEVPDYLIDSISFTVMHDPVMTKTGNSYDRVTLMEHFKRSHTDPLTREPLRADDIRPNLALKQACEDFLENNGWAVDY